MDATEMVSRVVVDARRNARLGSEVDEQEWFDAGEPDTMPNLLRQPSERARRRSRPATWLLLAAVLVIVGTGFAVGFYLGRG